ncbi:MAG: TonB-dependent receptor plug domain-containing protein [Opitutaceae bacterium]|nr:TonB-dependent receptor plug domain-containing protein [Cytophagales bacterium]
MRYLFIFLLFSISAFAQQDSSVLKSYDLPEVSVVQDRSKSFSTGQRIVIADSVGLANRTSYTLAEQLSFGNTNFIRSYGGNGLATLSLQGSSDVHSAVVWNGFNLQSVMNGTFDLSLFPVFFTDEVAVQTGSASNLWGSGAVGGSVLLNNKPDYGNKLNVKVNTETGSYGQYRQQIKTSYGSKNWYGSVKGFYSEARNDYPINSTRDVSQNLTHSATNQKGVLAENYFKWKNNAIAVRLWLQDNFRQNPTTELNGTIYHNFRRTNIEYHKNFKNFQWHSRTAWLREDIFYKDPIRTENTKSLADALIAENELRFQLHKSHLLNLGLNLTHQQASVVSNNYSDIAYLISPDADKYQYGIPVRQLMALFGQYRFKTLNDKLTLQLSARQELVKNIKVPLVPAFGLEYKPLMGILFKGNATRLFRIPTFNELYWLPGGNRMLVPESGWNAEASVRFTAERKSVLAFYEFATFRRQIENWIRWVPDGSYWSAKNIAVVNTEGYENKIGAALKGRKSVLKLTISSSYIFSRTDKSILENDKSLGLQVIFIPMYQGNGNLNYSYGGFYVEYNHTYSGYVYTSSDHSQWLKPFHVGNVMVSHSLPFKNFKTSFVFRINNIWNTDYRTVVAYPMPPRHFTAGITIDIHQLNSQK